MLLSQAGGKLLRPPPASLSAAACTGDWLRPCSAKDTALAGRELRQCLGAYHYDDDDYSLAACQYGEPPVEALDSQSA